MANNTSSLKSESKKKQFILFGICSFLALGICMATLVVTVRNVEKENSTTSTEDIYGGKELLENNNASVCEYIYTVTNKTQNDKFVKVNTFTDVYVDDGEILVDGKAAGADVGLFSYVKNKLLPVVDGFYGEDYTGVFGTVYNKMPLVELSACENVNCNLTVGQSDENGAPLYDDSGNLIDKEYYFLTITAEDVSSLNAELEQSFGAENLPDIKGEFIKEIAQYCTVSGVQVTPEYYEIRAKVNILTDEIAYIETERVYKVASEVSFLKELAAFGEKEIEFTYKVVNKYEYFYAGVTLSADELYLEKGSEEVINVNAVIEDDSEYKVTFSSSDESKVTVDEMGYVYAKENTHEPVYVTVELEYLGEVFTDSCAVYVKPQND